VTNSESTLDPPEDVPAVSAEELVDGALAPAEIDEPRRYPSTIGGLFYLLVLAMTLIGLALVWFDSWRTGVRWVGGSLLFAAVVRLALSGRNAGMLAVRHRAVDATLLTGVGLALLALANSIPNQPG
jgi:Protein of unknown function (DUF3017)